MRRVLAGLAALGLSATTRAAQIVLTPERQPAAARGRRTGRRMRRPLPSVSSTAGLRHRARAAAAAGGRRRPRRARGRSPISAVPTPPCRRCPRAGPLNSLAPGPRHVRRAGSARDRRSSRRTAARPAREAVAGPGDGIADPLPTPCRRWRRCPCLRRGLAPAQTAATQPRPASLRRRPARAAPDLAYGAFQRGFYLTAFEIAIARAEAGDVAAQTLIAIIYEGGYGVPQDFAKAVEWYRLAADAGDREAQFALGMMYMQGRGVDQNRKRGVDYIEKAANQGQVDAMYNLGLLLMEGTLRANGPEPGRAASRRRRRPRAVPTPQYALAQLYAVGDGRPAGRVAGRCSGSPRRRGWASSPAQVDYAIRLFNGIGVAKDAGGRRGLVRARRRGRRPDRPEPPCPHPRDRRRARRPIRWPRRSGTTSPATPARTTTGSTPIVEGLSPEQRQAALEAVQRWPGG